MTFRILLKRYETTKEIDISFLEPKNARVYIQILEVQRDIPQFKLDQNKE